MFEEIMTENNLQIQEAQQILNRTNTRRSRPTHITVKMTARKRKTLKATSEKQPTTCKGTAIQLTSDNIGARRK